MPSRIPANEKIGSVTTDGAYETLGYHDAVVDRGAAPFSPNRNAKPWTTLTAARDKLLRTSKYFGREL